VSTGSIESCCGRFCGVGVHHHIELAPMSPDLRVVPELEAVLERLSNEHVVLHEVVA
jgi:hypothetical protein